MNDNDEQLPTFDKEVALNYIKFEAEGASATDEQVTMAYSYLIKNHLDDIRPFYRKKAINLIEMGIVDLEGIIDWDIYDELKKEGYVIRNYRKQN